MVTIRFSMDDEFMNNIPAHRRYINFLINNNTIDNYAVRMETLRSWIIFNATDKKKPRK